MESLNAQNPTSIQGMFSVISKKYDLANTVLSLGIHHSWKRKVIRKSGLQSGQSVLDCATGTGDLAFLFESRLAGSGKVVGTDFCEPMLAVAREKAKNHGSQVQFEWADVTQLPYANQSFDVATISFGIRNVKDPLKGLQELGRVVKPGGRVVVLEFGQPRYKMISALYSWYSQKILPVLGGWISGQPAAYRYLQTSSAAFPCGDAFLKLAQATGEFNRVKYYPLQFGIAYLYVLEKKA